MTFMNHRTDEYGGALENRLPRAREILEGDQGRLRVGLCGVHAPGLKSYIKGYNQPSLHGGGRGGPHPGGGAGNRPPPEAYGYDCLSVDFGQYDSFYYAAPPATWRRAG